MSPAPALSIASARGVPGTAGALLRAGDGAPCLLTSHHVAFGGGCGAGDPVWALPPVPWFGPPGGPVRIGSVRMGLIGRVTCRGEPVFVDCALVALDDAEAFPAWLRAALAGLVRPAAAPARPGQRVTKAGAVTGLTRGMVVDVSYPDHPCIDGRWWTTSGQILVDPADPELNFAAPGDSGAAILNEAGRMVALLWGVNQGGQGIACPIGAVLDALALDRAEPGARRAAG
jgi:hypothetical protein